MLLGTVEKEMNVKQLAEVKSEGGGSALNNFKQ